MKNWEKPDMLVLDVNKTAQGNDSRTRADKSYYETKADGGLKLCYEFGLSGSMVSPEPLIPGPESDSGEV